MRNLARRIGLAAAVLGLVVGARTAQAGVTFFTSRTAFNVAAPGIPVEDFEKALVGAGGILGMPNVLDQFTNNSIFHTGDIRPGLRIESPEAGADNFALSITGAGFDGIVPSKSVFGTYFGTSLVVTFFGQNPTAVGLDVLSYPGGGNRAIGVFGPGNLLIATTTVNASTTGTFAGFVSTDVITGVAALGVSRFTTGFDNVAFGPAAVPEPASFIMASTAVLVGLCYAWRRRRLVAA